MTKPDAGASAPDPSVHPLTVRDDAGIERSSFLLSLPRWDESARSLLREVGGDFRVVILVDPSPVEDVPRGVAVCVPAGKGRRPAVREARAAYRTGAAEPSDIARQRAGDLSQGRIVTSVPLVVSPRDVFGEDPPRLELLVGELLLAEAVSDLCLLLGGALFAPARPPQPYPLKECLADLRGLVEGAVPVVAALPGLLLAEPAAAIERLSQLAGSGGPPEALGAVGRLYPEAAEVAEDVYVLRAVVERPGDAAEVLTMRAWVNSALVPEDEPELGLDRAIALEQVRFANIVPEPNRIHAARTAAGHFQARYRKSYDERHGRFWKATASLHALLAEARRPVAALQRLNSLTELGPPVGERATARYSELLQETAGCRFSGDLGEALSGSPLCPGCAIPLNREPPHDQVTQTLSRLQRALSRHMTRLSSTAVRQLLERDGNPRVERFLQVVQASQLSSLPDVLDDRLVAYLRRFLVESRVNAILAPLLLMVEEGRKPDETEVRAAIREITGVMGRAVLGAPRAAGPGTLEEKRDEKPEQAQLPGE